MQFADAERVTPQGTDDTLRYADDGFQYYVDPAPEVQGDAASRISRTAAAVAPLNQTFALHSLASSPRKLFLDFDGYTIPGPRNDWSKATPGPVSGFNLEAPTSSFSALERTRIQEIWQIVAEKYAPFKVDVTTQDPGTDALQRTSTSDGAFGVQVIVTHDPRPPKQGCGTCAGTANLAVFDNPAANDRRNAWVYAGKTSGNAVATANVIAHEAGHTFGLNHDGRGALLGDQYYGGQGNWIPIMGLSTNAFALAQFSKGEYANANNREDDLAIIAAHGAPLRADDYPDSPATAGTLPTDSAYRRSGIIRSPGDVDVFKISRTCSGNVTATASPIGLSGTLDIDLKMYGAAANLLGASNPPSGQHPNAAGDAVPDGVSASVTLPAATPGSYYVRLDGSGNGDPRTTGYSDYGSVGQYTVTVTGCPATKPTAPKIRAASPGKKGGTRNAIARWAAPASTGGTPVTSYKVTAYQLSAKGKVVKTRVSGARKATTRSYTWALPAGRYKFRVVAYNKVGAGPRSAFSRIVVSR